MVSDKPVLVTGGTSYVGSYIVKTLLDRKHKVRATVRSLNSPNVVPIRALDPSGNNLELVEADMANVETFPSLVSGVCAVIHCAIPVYYPVDGTIIFDTPEEAERLQVQPPLTSTKALLESAKAANVDKFVLTSSGAAMRANPKNPPVLDESCWSDEELCRQNMLASGSGAYVLAKTMQEKLAWQLSEALHIKLVSINPVCVWGPSLTGRLSSSLEVLLSLAQGKGVAFTQSAPGTIPSAYIPFVDTREVALAHVLAVEKDDAEGRYLLCSASKHSKDILRVLRENETFAKLPDLEVDKGELDVPLKFDNSKLRAFGVNEIPWEDTIRESAKALVEGGHVSPRYASTY